MSVLPAVRCEALEGVLELPTAPHCEPGALYVVSLREGELWPLITTHSTSEKVLILPKEEQEPEEEKTAPAPAPAAPEPVVPAKPSLTAFKRPIAARSEQLSPRSAAASASSAAPSASSSSSSPRGLNSSSLPPLPAPPRNAASARAPAPPAGSSTTTTSRNAESARPISPRSEKGAVPEKLIVRMLEELSIRTRQHNGREVPLSFTGISLVSWLVQTVKTVETRDDALKWGRAMMKQDVFFAADDGQPFVDEHVPFVINLDHPLVGPNWARVAAAPSKLVRKASSPALNKANGGGGGGGGALSPRSRGPAASSSTPSNKPPPRPAPSNYQDDYK